MYKLLEAGANTGPPVAPIQPEEIPVNIATIIKFLRSAGTALFVLGVAALFVWLAFFAPKPDASYDSRFAENCGVDPIGTGGAWVDGCEDKSPDLQQYAVRITPADVHVYISADKWSRLSDDVHGALACQANQPLISGMMATGTFDLAALTPCLSAMPVFELHDGQITAQSETSFTMTPVTVSSEVNGITVSRTQLSYNIGNDRPYTFLVRLRTETTNWSDWEIADGSDNYADGYIYQIMILAYNPTNTHANPTPAPAGVDWADVAKQVAERYGN